MVTGVAGLTAFAWAEGALYFYPSNRLKLLTLALVAPVYVAVLILNNPKPFKPPESAGRGV